MKNNVKRVLALLLAVMMVLGLNGFSVLAETISEQQELDAVADENLDGGFVVDTEQPAAESPSESGGRKDRSDSSKSDVKTSQGGSDFSVSGGSSADQAATFTNTGSDEVEEGIEEEVLSQAESVPGSTSSDGEGGSAVSSGAESMGSFYAESFASSAAESFADSALESTEEEAEGADSTPAESGDEENPDSPDGAQSDSFADDLAFDPESVTSDAESLPEEILPTPIPTKKVYEYEAPDGSVKVTATLQYPEAVPDDAEFRVTPVTAQSQGYNYDAYMDALNDPSAEDVKYTEQNTLLYDIAFIVKETDEEGNEKEVELQPEAGSVAIDIDFRNGQLSGLGAEEDADLNITHLPLVDEIRENVDTTADAENITANQILVEEVSAPEVNAEAEVVGFETSNLSVFAFTVDFHYNGKDYSIPGETQILLSELIQIMGITYPDSEELVNVADVESVKFTDEHLVSIEQVSGVITYTAEDGIQEGVDVGEKDFLLSSLVPFTSEEVLTIRLVGGEEIKVGVTDDQSGYPVTISYKYSDGSNAVFSSDNTRYIMVLAQIEKDGKTYYANVTKQAEAYNSESEQTIIFSSFKEKVKENGADYTYQSGDQVSVELYWKNDQDIWSQNNLQSEGTKIENGSSLDGYTFAITSNSNGTTITGTKAVYKVEFSGITEDIGSNFWLYIWDKTANSEYRYVYKSDSALTINPSTQTQIIDTFKKDGNGDIYRYRVGDEIEFHLYKASNLNLEGGAPKIENGVEEITNGSVVNGNVITISSISGKTTISASKPDPYHYSISVVGDEEISLDSDYAGYWYMLSTLTKGDGSKYYYVKKLTDNVSTISPLTDQTISCYYTADSNNLSNITIGNETANNYNSGNTKTSVYQTGDTVDNCLIFTGSTNATTYNDILNSTGKQVFKDRDIVNKYEIDSPASSNGVGAITLTKVSDLKLVTEFKEWNGASSTDVPSGYKLLLKMMRDGNTYYALVPVSTNNPSAKSETIKFYQYIRGQNGSADTIGSIPYYYTGSDAEILTTQVVTGADALTNPTVALVNHEVGGTVFYNENTVNTSPQKSDLTKDLFSTSSTVAKDENENIMTTTFTRQKNEGVPHEIEVNFYTEKHNYPGEDSKKVSNAELSGAEGAYYFVIRLYNEGKLVAYKVKKAEDVNSANNGGTFSTIIGADETFTIVDDKGNDIANSDHVKYDPTVYTSKVRLYKANEANRLPSKLAEVGNEGVDKLDGYDFMYNKDWTSDSTLMTTDSEDNSIIKTKTRLGLYKAYKKKYQVKIVIDDGSKLTAGENGDKLNLFVQAIHETTNIDSYTQAIPGSLTAETVDGKTIYTILIEDQTTGAVTRNWTSGDQSNTITGNETFTLYLKQGTSELPDGYPISLTNGQSGKNYKVIYDTDTVDENGIFLPKNVTTENDVTTITHYVRIEEAQYDSALTPFGILGDAGEFGVVADYYNQNGHTETNFATNKFNQGDKVELEGSGTGAAPFYISSFDGSSKLILANDNRAEAIDVFVPTGYSNRVDYSEVDPSKCHSVNVIEMSQSSIKDYVDGLINQGKAVSEEFASKTTYAPVSSDAQYEVDLRAFPDNTTIYVDASGIMNAVSGSLRIRKKENQYVVFNFPGVKTVNINQFQVFIGDADTSTTSVTKEKNSDEDWNKNVDNVILKHIAFNMQDATSIDLNTVAGIFIAPKADSSLSFRNSAGWIISAGNVTGGGEWHFYHHDRNYVSRGSSVISGTKTLQGRHFKNGDSVTISLEAITNGAPMPSSTTVTINPTSGTNANFAFGSISYTFPDAVSGDTAAGRTVQFTYKVTESVCDMSGVTKDQSEYEVTLTFTDNGDNTSNVLKTYKRVKDTIGNTIAEDTQGISFVNTYSTGDVTAQLSAKKKANSTLGEREFEFELYRVDPKPNGTEGETEDVWLEKISEVKQGQSKNFNKLVYSLSDLDSEQSKDYTYKIKEGKGGFVNG